MTRQLNKNASTLVVICHYNAWSTQHLLSLCDELFSIDAGADFDVTIVVNRAKDINLELPQKYQHIPIIYRKNLGFNIGAWDEAWRKNPDYNFYVFLQEECKILKKQWLEHYIKRVKKKAPCIMGESLEISRHWELLKNKYPLIYQACQKIASEKNIELGASSTHLQTIIMAASSDVMNAMDGFLSKNDKVQAMGAEVMISRHASMKNIRLVQCHWQPYYYIYHPQWNALKKESASLLWSMRRFIKIMFNFLFRR
jgi:hypothetical protein